MQMQSERGRGRGIEREREREGEEEGEREGEGGNGSEGGKEDTHTLSVGVCVGGKGLGRECARRRAGTYPHFEN
jgi:hypothetical protein